MNRLEPMACDPECVLNCSMDREKTLRLRFRLEPPHLALSLSGALVGRFGPAVLVLPGLVDSRQGEFPTAAPYFPSLSVTSCQGEPPCPINSLRKKRLAALASRRRVIRVSRTFPSWSTALQGSDFVTTFHLR